MAGHWTDLYSFVFGAVRYKDLAYLVLANDEMSEQKIPHSIVIEWDNGVWNDGGQLPWRTAGVAVAVKPLEQLVALGEFGSVLLLGSGDRHEEQVWQRDSSPADRGPMRGVRTIGESVYAVGMDRQIYQRQASGAWRSFDADLRPPPESEVVVGLEAIDGFDEQEMYAVGWEGEIWWFDAGTWTNVASPTNLVLTDVCCGGDGVVYACGQAGMVLRGRESRWEMVGQEVVRDDLWNSAWFDGHMYFASLDALYMLDGDDLEIVDPDVEGVETYHHLSTRDDVLWSVGAKDVVAYDGMNWSRID